MSLIYTLERNSNGCSLYFKGDITFTDHTILKSVFPIIKDFSSQTVRINLKEISFVNAAGLGMFLLLHEEAKKCETTLILSHPQNSVEKMFRLAFFYDLFQIE